MINNQGACSLKNSPTPELVLTTVAINFSSVFLVGLCFALQVGRCRQHDEDFLIFCSPLSFAGLAGLPRVRTSVNNKMSSGPSLLLSRSTRASPDRVASGRLGSPDTRTKDVWVWTRNRDVMSAAVESGWTTLIFTPDTTDLAYDWTCKN